jgi:two-component system response regulator MprA
MKASPTAKLLVVEDDAKLRSVLERTLTFEGYEVASCSDGVSGLEALTNSNFDAVILDVSMPYLDGVGLCRRMRERGHMEPVLFLTARTTIADRVAGLDAGGDDYLTKPFSIEELLARLRALLRRPAQPATSDSAPIQIGDLTIDAQQRRCWYPDADVELTKIEFDLLLALAVNKEIVIERSRLYELVWGYDATETRTLDATISYLRRKLKRPGQPPLIHTLRGIGYVIREPR